jgi:cytochrome c oxidase cbb3-type subunit 1
MPIDDITDGQALGFILGVIVVAWVVFRVIPGAALPPRRTSYDDEAIGAYDRALPKYFLAAIIALAVGGAHAVVKSIPPVYAWLTEAGHGGHMVRDLANTHLVIVIGGTIAATGLVWYVLPRIAGRPLYSNLLATWSFWLTVAGAAGFYLANVVLGLIFGQMAHDGIDYETAKSMLGAMRTIPIALSASVMGVGYWMFAAEIFLTIWAARRIAAPRPHRHLLKFFGVGGLGLLIGTIQGVIQVMPANEAWLHAAGPAGEFIDPIAHAHVNLVTGTLALVAGLVFYASTRGSVGAGQRRAENIVFWILVPGSLAFYGAFMTIGWVEGHLITDAGLSYQEAVARLGPLHPIPLMIAGSLTLAGIEGLVLIIVGRYWRGGTRLMAGAPLVMLAAAALVVGTAQGLVQILPPVKTFLLAAGESGDAIPNAHAQLNMLGGVVPALLGVAISLGPGALGVAISRELSRRVAWFVGIGIGTYYVSAVAGNIVTGYVFAYGGSVPLADAAALLGGTAMAMGAALYSVGFTTLAIALWRATAKYRADGWHAARRAIASYNSEPAGWRRRIPLRFFLGAEAVGSLVGFPGLGWALGGLPLIGLPLLMIGPAIPWAIIPLLTSPYGSAPLGAVGPWQAVLMYLLTSTAVSSAGLYASLRLRRRRSTVQAPSIRPSLESESRA